MYKYDPKKRRGRDVTSKTDSEKLSRVQAVASENKSAKPAGALTAQAVSQTAQVNHNAKVVDVGKEEVIVVETTVEPSFSIELSQRDTEKFIESVWNSPGPSEKLKAAAARYRKRTGK